MTPVLLDTSVLVRLANTFDAGHRIADRAVAVLQARGEDLCIAPQILVEFRPVATRPIGVNGLGLSATEADAKAAVFEAAFRLLPDTPDIHPAWKGIVSALGVIGKTVHDARLVAVCHVHTVGGILTFNVGHFTRLTSHGPPVAVTDPAAV